MPRSVYSTLGHDATSRFNPIKQVKRLAAVFMVMSIALLGTATLAGATAVGTPVFTPTSAVAAATTTWTATFVSTSAIVAGAGNTVTLTFPSATFPGTTIPATPTITLVSGFTGTGCTATGSTTSAVVTVALGTTCAVAGGGATVSVGVVGIVNPAAGVITAGGFTAKTSVDSTSATPATVSPAIGTPLVVPTTTNIGTGAITVGFAADGVATSYAVTDSPANGTGCAAITTGITAGTAETCAFTGLTDGTSYTFTVTPTGGTPTVSTAQTSGAVTSGALNALTLARAGSGAVKVTFTTDGVATLYTVTSSPASAGCIVSGPVSAIPSGSQFCYVSGLANGTAYTFTVTPSGNSTTSLASPTATITPGAALATPKAINAGTSSAVIFFTADGVATTYTIRGVSTTTDTCIITVSTPLTGAQSCLDTTAVAQAGGYIVTPSGNSTSSTASPASNATVMSAVLGASTTGLPAATLGGAGAATVTWLADGVASMYTVNLIDNTSAARNATKTIGSVATGAAAVAAGTQSVTFTGLTTGDNVDFTVLASGNGTGLTSVSSPVSNAVVISNALGTPTVANAGTGAVTVSFVADGAATTYTVSNASGGTPGANTCVVANTSTPPTGAQSCTVTGLANATAYTFIVTPSNGGTSGASAASKAVTTVSALATPTIGTAANGSVVVNFTADGVASTYVVTSTPGSFTCTVINTTTAPTGAQHCTVTGLTNGTSYTFTVTPSGNSTTTVVSAKSAAAIPGAALATPTVVNSGNQAVTVAFVADGVASTYTVQSNLALTPFTAGTTCIVANTTVAPTGAQSCKVTGLTNGVAYTFTVTPSGNSTVSSQSAASASITPTAALATPTVANAGTGAIKVSFVADGVAATYTVANASGGTPGANTCVVANTLVALTGAQTCTVTGLSNGTSYTFTVTPSGSATSPGTTLTSTVSLASASIEVGVNFLAAPTVAYAASGSALVSFAADGVASTYVVTSTPGGFTCSVINSTVAPTGAQHCTVAGLTLGTSYTFHVVPSGNATTSLQSPESAAYVAVAALAPAAPAATATGGTNSVVVTWTAPTNTGGSPITGYVVTATSGNTTVTCGTVAATATTCTVTGLAASTAYAVTVAAVNAIGTSPVATASATTSAATVVVTTGRPHIFTTGAHGTAVVGKTVTITISGGGFYGQPTLTSTAAGTRASVSHDSGSLLTVRVTVTSASARGEHTFTITLANGKSAKVNYRTV